jgi:DNA repair exonuclease SbcCD ATPase subunit
MWRDWRVPADDLERIADELYGLPPEDFTAARDAAAKQARNKALRDAVKALRRPTVSAWLVNQLQREHADVLEQLLELGPALAEAQEKGAAAQLRALGEQRRDLIGAVTDTAVERAGADVSSSTRTEVSATLEAALADPHSAEAVRSGRLVRALSFAGFGGVDLEGAVAVQPVTSRRPPQKTRPRKSAKRTSDDAVARAERVAQDAAGVLDDAVRARREAERARAAADRTAEKAHGERQAAEREAADLARQLADAEERVIRAARVAKDAGRQRDDASRAAERATQSVRQAQNDAERARHELDAIRRGTPRGSRCS